MDRCPKCRVELVEVDNPFRYELRPRRGLEDQCKGGEGCPLGWPALKEGSDDG